MTVLLPFIVNAGLNFVLGLLIAYCLGPAAFGLYAIGAAIVVLVNTALLDWLRLSAIRFYSLTVREKQPEIRATLDLLAAGISIALSGLLVAAIVAGIDFRLPAMLLAASVLGGMGAGLFDYHGAIARARFLDAAYAKLIIVKNLLALILMVGGAWITRDPTVVLLGGLLSVAVALLLVRRALADAPLSLSAARRDVAWGFLLYSLPLIGSNAIYSLIPLINRSLLAGAHGFAEAGYFSLASDMGLKLFGTLASTLEIVLLREVIRLDEHRGRPAALRRIAENVVVVLMVTLPIAAGLWLILPAFERLLVPESFRGHFASYMAILLPGFMALTISQSAFIPVFLLGKRTGIAPLATGLGLACNLLLAFVVSVVDGPQRYAYAQASAFIVALLVTASAALRSLPKWPPLRDTLYVILAVLLMAAVVWPLGGRFSAPVELVLQVGLGAIVYAATVLGLDVMRCRSKLMLWRAMRRSGGAPV
jgi:O-antigen/teichoic acid export membrane protein